MPGQNETLLKIKNSLNIYIEFHLIKAIKSSDNARFSELMEAYEPLAANIEIVKAALESNDDDVLEEVYDKYASYLTEEIQQLFIKRRLLIAIKSSVYERFSNLIGDYNDSEIDNDIVNAALTCDENDIFKNVYKKYESDLTEKTKSKFVRKAVEKDYTDFLEEFFEDLDDEYSQIKYSKIALDALIKKGRRESDELLSSISEHISGLRVFCVIALYLTEIGAPEQYIMHFLSEYYDEPVYLWEEMNAITTDIDILYQLVGYFDALYPDREYLEGDLHDLSADSICRLIIILIKKGSEEELIHTLIEKKDLKELWEELQFITIEEDILNPFIKYALTFIDERGVEGFEDIQTELKSAQGKLKNRLYSPYPIEDFAGDKSLGEKRVTLYANETLHVENKVAATLIGHPLTTNYHLFPNSTPYDPCPLKHAEKYFRGSTHPLHKLFEDKKADASIGANIKGGVGNAPQGTHKKDATQKLALADSYQCGDMYDFFLEQKHATCSLIEKTCKDFTAIKVGFYHQYPCIMVYIVDVPEDFTDPKKEGWTQLLISFFVGLANYKAQKLGLPIELVRRSSFGFLTPTIAPCHQSFRINVGVIPPEYIVILTECLETLNAVLNIFSNKELHKKKLLLTLPEKGFLSQEQKIAYEEYKGEQLKVNDILQLVHSDVTKPHGHTGDARTGAVQLVATAEARMSLTIIVHNELVRTDTAIENIYRYANAFLKALQWGFGECNVMNDTLSFDKSTCNIRLLTFESAANPLIIKDENYFKIIGEKIALVIKRYTAIKGNKLDDVETTIINVIGESLTKKDIGLFYYNLEKLNEMIFAKTISFNADRVDPYGSDSCDDEEELQQGQRIYHKKAIVNHGMMSIMRSIEVAAEYLTSKGHKRIEMFFHGIYYEVEGAFGKLKKQLKEKQIIIVKIDNPADADIIIYDINPCVTSDVPFEKLDLPTSKIWIADTTSATVQMQSAELEKYRHSKNTEALFLVSSGLKNEQMGADKMPYGTIRFFTKDKKILEDLTARLRGGKELTSGLPHNYRRMMKVLGFVPRNRGIVNYVRDKHAPSASDASSTSVGASSSVGDTKDNKAGSVQTTKKPPDKKPAVSSAPPVLNPEFVQQQTFAAQIVTTPLYREIIGGLQPDHVTKFEIFPDAFLQSDERQIIFLYEAQQRNMPYQVLQDQNDPTCNALEFKTGIVVLSEIITGDIAGMKRQIRVNLEKHKNKKKPVYMCINKGGSHYTTLAVIPILDEKREHTGKAHYRYIEPLKNNRGKWVGLDQNEREGITQTFLTVFPQGVEVIPNIDYKKQQHYKGCHNNECGIHNVFNILLMLQQGPAANMATMRQHFNNILGTNPTGNGGIDPDDTLYYLRPFYSQLFQLVLTHMPAVHPELIDQMQQDSKPPTKVTPASAAMVAAGDPAHIGVAAPKTNISPSNNTAGASVPPLLHNNMMGRLGGVVASFPPPPVLAVPIKTTSHLPTSTSNTTAPPITNTATPAGLDNVDGKAAVTRNEPKGMYVKGTGQRLPSKKGNALSASSPVTSHSVPSGNAALPPSHTTLFAAPMSGIPTPK